MGILKGIDPILTADLLHVLRAMGHGDKLCVCDANFPAVSTAAATVRKAPVILAGVDLPQALEAICSVFPLDYFVERPALHMGPQPGVAMPPLGHEVIGSAQAAIAKHSPGVLVTPLERFAFYAEANTCFAVVQTAERRPYGNLVLVKGVIGPDGRDLRP
jgi:L-fucose mutarotase